MTISSEIVRIKTAIADAYTACQDMGATMPAVMDSDNLEQCIASISGGGSSATVLHLYDRVDGKATVAGFWTDGSGQRYAVCVADAQYRNDSGMNWSTNNITESSLQSYGTAGDAINGTQSGTYNTDTILDNYTATDYPAFNFARNSLTITVDNKTFESCLPNAFECNNLSSDKTVLDSYDPTISSYPTKSLSNLIRSKALWTSNRRYDTDAWGIGYTGTVTGYSKQASFGVCPIIEIPVDENGEVQ